MKLGCALLYVKDLPRMRQFYENILNVRPVNTQWPENWALFDLGGAEFALHAIPQEAAPSLPSAPPAAVREHSAVKLVFHVENVPVQRARLESMGVPMLQRTWQNPEESCDGVDPEGNVFQIAAVKSWSSLAGR